MSDARTESSWTATTAPELATWLLAQIDEDERVARAAAEAPWTSRHDVIPTCHIFGDFGWLVRGPDVETADSDQGRATADHIARHDPARVLAECDAKRRLIKAVEGDPFDAMGAEPDYERTVLQHLALPYADRDGYREEWKP